MTYAIPMHMVPNLDCDWSMCGEEALSLFPPAAMLKVGSSGKATYTLIGFPNLCTL